MRARHLQKWHHEAEIPEGLSSSTATSFEIAGDVYENATLFEFEGLHYVMSHKAILTVNMTPRCNAACSFCYNGVTFLPGSGPLDPESEPVTRVLRFAAAAGMRSVSISGGEPTLYAAQLLDLLGRLAKQFPGFRRLHTNGSQLFTRGRHSEGRKLYEELATAGLTDLSISRAHWHSGTNAELMKMPAAVSLVDSQLEEVAALGVAIRLSCFLMPSGVSSVGDVAEYIEWGRARGVKDFVFRLSSGIPDRFSLPGTFRSGNEIHLQETGLTTHAIRDHLLSSGYEVTFSRHEVDYDLYIMSSPDGVEVSVDRSSEVPDPDRKIRRLILMPNGVCYTSWLESASTLFPDGRVEITKRSRSQTSRSGRFPAATSRRLYTLAKPPFTVDAHVHSTVSDGLHSPSKVLRHLAAAGVETAFFTEHGGVHDRFDELQAVAADMGVRLPCPAVEIAARHGNAENAFRLHLLVYGDAVRSPEFLDQVGEANRHNNARVLTALQRLRSSGWRLPADREILSADDTPGVQSQSHQYSRRLVASLLGQIDARLEAAFQTELANIPRWDKYSNAPLASDLLPLATDMGLVVVLAHPAWVRTSQGLVVDDLDELLASIVDLVGLGLDGVEVSHRRHTGSEETQLMEFSKSMDLVVTGGSDYHGRPNHVLGEHGMTGDQLEFLLDRLESKAVARPVVV